MVNEKENLKVHEMCLRILLPVIQEGIIVDNQKCVNIREKIRTKKKVKIIMSIKKNKYVE